MPRPVHGVAGRVRQWIVAESFLNRGAPRSSPWLAASPLVEESKDSSQMVRFDARCEHTKIADIVTVPVRDVVRQRCQKRGGRVRIQDGSLRA